MFLIRAIQGVVFMVCTPGLATISFGALAEDWKKLSAADAPSKLLSLTFPDGSLLDGSHSGSWGAWTVFIDPRDPAIVNKAGLQSVFGHPEQQYHTMSISHLKCRNNTVGEVICFMSLSENPARGGDVCVVLGQELGQFRIECPTDVKLGR